METSHPSTRAVNSGSGNRAQCNDDNDEGPQQHLYRRHRGDLECSSVREVASQSPPGDEVNSDIYSCTRNSQHSSQHVKLENVPAAAMSSLYVKPGFHPNAIACVACVVFGWKPGLTL